MGLFLSNGEFQRSQIRFYRVYLAAEKGVERQKQKWGAFFLAAWVPAASEVFGRCTDFGAWYWLKAVT